MPGKCFPFLILRKTLSFPLFTKRVPSSSDYRDWRNWWIRRTELGKKRIFLLHHSREEEEEVWFRHRHRHHILRDQLITQQEICDLGTSISIPAVNMIKKRVSLCRPLNEDELRVHTPVVISCNEGRKEVSAL
uniref:Uncharacterized protein n=1 Tax=Populus trichocarpa TaxID=3694 RepID=A0A3N7G2Q9_POPTR